MSYYFFFAFLSTVVLTRIFLFLFPVSSPTVHDLRLHHWMYGVFGILIGLATHQLMIFSISLGLFVDELTYLIIGGTSHRDNYSPISILGTIAFIVAVFFLRDYLVAPFTHL